MDGRGTRHIYSAFPRTRDKTHPHRIAEMTETRLKLGAANRHLRPGRSAGIALTMIRWTRGHGNKDWDVRMKEYTSFKGGNYSLPLYLVAARQMRLMIARMCRCVSQRRRDATGFLGFWRRRSDITGRLPIGIAQVITRDPDDGKRKPSPELPPSVKGFGPPNWRPRGRFLLRNVRRVCRSAGAIIRSHRWFMTISSGYLLTNDRGMPLRHLSTSLSPISF